MVVVVVVVVVEGKGNLVVVAVVVVATEEVLVEEILAFVAAAVVVDTFVADSLVFVEAFVVDNALVVVVVVVDDAFDDAVEEAWVGDVCVGSLGREGRPPLVVRASHSGSLHSLAKHQNLLPLRHSSSLVLLVRIHHHRSSMDCVVEVVVRCRERGWHLQKPFA